MPTRTDSEGRDVTNLPGLWSESDTIQEEAMSTPDDHRKLDLLRYPYEVYNQDAEPDTPRPKFQTWKAALAAQKEWNKTVGGHVARKRR